PKIYFVDVGARNYFLKNFTGIEERNDAGFLAEEFVFSQYLKKSDFLTEIKYWRDKNGREIDFVIQRENFITAYEVKAKQRITRKDVSHLLYFKKNYPEVKTNLVNWRKPQLNITEINEIDFLEM
ncbi:MAG: DUF4143 domain-containing protein, partial [Calditrichia bacterium]